MNAKRHKKNILKNCDAISEEFTALPALSIIMIGFTIFILLITNTYNSYNSRIENLKKYQTADFIIAKLTNPDCFFIKEAGLINLPILEDTETSDEILNNIREQYKTNNVNFIVRVSYENTSIDFPKSPDPNILLSNALDRVALSKDAGIYINEAQTKPGELTIILWMGKQ